MNTPHTLSDMNANIRQQAENEENRFCALMLKDKARLAEAIRDGITHQHFQDDHCRQFYALQRRYYEQHDALLTSETYLELLEKGMSDVRDVAKYRECFGDMITQIRRVTSDDYSHLSKSILARHTQIQMYDIVSKYIVPLSKNTANPLKLIQKIKDEMAAINTNVTEPLPAIKNLADFTLGDDDGGCLLGKRFLCRGADWLVAAPTGVGKSCWTMQGAILFSLGRSFLGINPSAKLKSLIVQAENDAGDLSYMRDRVFKFLELSEEQCKESCQNVRIVCENAVTGERFIDLLDRLLTKCHAEGFKPDLLYIDPLFGYLGDDVSNQAAVSAFVRTGMKPLIQKYKVGLIMLHHTNKPQKDGAKPSGSDYAYLGSGSMELANAFRAVAGMVAVGEYGVFKFVVGKRGSLSGIVDEHNQPLNEFYVRWANQQDGIGFIRADDWTPTKKEATGHGADDLLALVPLTNDISSDKLDYEANDKGFSRRRYDAALKMLLADERLTKIEVPREGRRPAIHYRRTNHSQEQQEAVSIATTTVSTTQNAVVVTTCGVRDAVATTTPPPLGVVVTATQSGILSNRLAPPFIVNDLVQPHSDVSSGDSSSLFGDVGLDGGSSFTGSRSGSSFGSGSGSSSYGYGDER